MGRNSCCVKQKLRKGLWSPEEDEKLYNYITRFGVGCWSSVPKLAGLQRCGKSCRLRWINYLRPDLKRGMFSQPEQDLILNLHQALGNRWAQIAAQLPGRTDNEIKNFWNSSLKKKLLKQGVDPNTHKPMNDHAQVVMIKDEIESSAADFGSYLINEGKMVFAAPRDNFPSKQQVYDPLFLSEFQANLDHDHDHGVFQSNFLSHTNPNNPNCGFNSMPDLTNFDHQSLGEAMQYPRMSKFVTCEGKEGSNSMMMETNNNNNNDSNSSVVFSWDEESKTDWIQIEERKVQNQINIITDDFDAYPLNMSVFDHSI